MSDAAASDCYAKALDLLARRSHFTSELESKLAARGFAEDEIRMAVERLTRRGYLDDRCRAVELVRGSLGRKDLGRRRLRLELRRRGAAEELVRRVLEEELAEPELEVARRVTGKWRSRGGRDRNALARHLDRRGFAPATVAAILDELGDAIEGKGR